MNRIQLMAIAAALAPLVMAAPTQDAAAFCGFYVSGADSKLYNDATTVTFLRHGDRTVMSMQNNYQGPPEDFAMVVPVPVVLQKEQVKTLDPAIFDKVDGMAAPRLVEYWERDPCAPPEPMLDFASTPTTGAMPRRAGGGGVVIEAQFKVGEYDIVILGADDALGLDTWLKENGYKIPAGAAPVLAPYIQQGTKFFVAKVDAKKVKMVDGKALLSPLRFHYDSKAFALPVRLGMLNAKGPQDLIVHILAEQRYEVANYKNVTIPTNIQVDDAVKGKYATFYAALFDATLKENPGSVVTEYAWAANTCDPCPGPTLTQADFKTLGADTLDSRHNWVLTRLHARYDKASLGEDLVFREAKPIVGGRERKLANGQLETGSTPDRYNNFQGRYIIRHAWKGEVKCDNPQRGIWGGPGGRGDDTPKTSAARRLGSVQARAMVLETAVREDVPEIKLVARHGGPPAVDVDPKPAAGSDPKQEIKAPPAPKSDDKTTPATNTGESYGPKKSNCTGGGGSASVVLLLALLGMLAIRRRVATRKG